jgi:hypothetical protein
MAMNHNNGNGHGNGEGENNGNGDHRSKLRNFQNTNPPMFTKSEEPLDADDWLRTMENNLAVAEVGENEKVLYTTHYLAGAARAWWDSTRAMQACYLVMAPRKLADGAEWICNSESLCVVMTSPLGTPRGRYDEYSG